MPIPGDTLNGKNTMDWMHQHHEAVEEINAYYSFIFRVQIRNQLRLLKPHLFFQYTRIVGLFPWRAGLDVPQLRHRMFDVLCSTDEKRNVFYRICVDPYPTAALSQHLAVKFPQHKWDAVEIAHQIRESAVPSFSFRQLLPWLALIVAVVQIGGSNPFKWVLGPGNPLDLSPYALVAAIYIVIFFVVYPFYLAWTRREMASRKGTPVAT